MLVMTHTSGFEVGPSFLKNFSGGPTLNPVGGGGGVRVSFFLGVSNLWQFMRVSSHSKVILVFSCTSARAPLCSRSENDI